MPNIVCRLGTSPKERGSEDSYTCPDIFLLDDGSWLSIGTKAGPEMLRQLPKYKAAVAPYEEAVVVPKAVRLAAVRDDLDRMPLTEFWATVWPRLSQTTGELLRLFYAAVQRWIEERMAQPRTAALFA